MKKSFTKIILMFVLTLLSVGMNAQITYAGGHLSINDAPTNNYFGLNIDKWLGMYWTCNSNKFFQLDLSPENPRLAGTGNVVVFFNSAMNKFNSIEAANVYNYSDARAKDNIKTLTSGLNAILQLRPVTYTWKKMVQVDAVGVNPSTENVASGPDEDAQNQYGFLAQEVENVVPDVVKTDKEGHKMINYTAIIPMLVQAVQDLQATVETQAVEIAKLSNKNVEFKSNSILKNKIISCIPNPTKSQVTISFKLENNIKSAILTINSITGTQERKISVSSSMETVSQDVSNLDPGIYLVSLFIDGNLIDSCRLIKN